MPSAVELSGAVTVGPASFRVKSGIVDGRSDTAPDTATEPLDAADTPIYKAPTSGTTLPDR
jgi:hypothetical protein